MELLEGQRLRPTLAHCEDRARSREAPVIVVRQGIPLRTAALRISPSDRAPLPVGVLITRSTSRLRMKSTTWGEPSTILLIARTGMPIREIACAVPLVAMISKPRS